MRLPLLIAVVLLVLQACGSQTINRHSIEGKLVAKIKSCQPAEVCTVRVKDVTNFDWDKIFVCKVVSQESVEKEVGFPLPEWEDFKRVTIFTRGGNLVRLEKNPTNIEHPINEQLIFDVADADACGVYGPDSVFEVTPQSSREGVYYNLKLVRQ